MNTTGLGSTPDDERRYEACKWYVEGTGQTKLPRELAEQWHQWAGDPANLAAFREFHRLHSMLGNVPPPSMPSITELRADSLDLDMAIQRDPTPDSARKSRASRWVQPVMGVLVSCAVVAIVMIAWAGGIPGLPGMTLARAEDYVVPPGAPRKVTLLDHSAATLSGSARLTALFSKHHRKLVLDQGEAFFDVRPDPTAPFQVQAAGARIVAAGTAFNVRRYSDSVVVSVATGAVTVIPDTPSNAVETLVKSGEQVTYDAKGGVGRPHPAPEAFTSWVSGRRVYRGEPLSKVVEDVQLYVPFRIDLDRALESVRFSGFIDELDSEEAKQWVHGLSRIYPVDVEANDHRMSIRCKTPSCPGLHR
jgi:transmembrane sensor